MSNLLLNIQATFHSQKVHLHVLKLYSIKANSLSIYIYIFIYVSHVTECFQVLVVLLVLTVFKKAIEPCCYLPILTIKQSLWVFFALLLLLL